MNLEAADDRIRRLRPAKGPVDPKRAHGTLLEDERRPDGTIEHALTVFLAGAECPFACSFCDLWQWTIDGPTPSGALSAQLSQALALIHQAQSIPGLELSPALFEERAHYLEGLQDTDGANAARRTATQFPPRSVRDYYMLAFSYAREGQLAQAVPQLKKAVALNPRHYWSRLMLGTCYDQLRDSHARLHDEALLRVRVEENDAQLTAVSGVDEAGRVDERDAVARCEAGARLHETGVALGNRHREPCPDDRPFAGAELHPLARAEVQASIAEVGPLGQNGVRTQPADRELDHRARRACPARASATRYRANR